MKTITVYYWHSPILEEKTKIKHKTQYEFSQEKLMELTLHILSCDLNVMTIQQKDDVVVFVDNGRFRQK